MEKWSELDSWAVGRQNWRRPNLEQLLRGVEGWRGAATDSHSSYLSLSLLVRTLPGKVFCQNQGIHVVGTGMGYTTTHS